jgi:hypothetical protein
LSGSPDDTEQLVSSLLIALSAPSQASFYQVRAATLKSAEIWDRISADWKLHTAARALRAPSPGTARLAQLGQVDNSAVLSVVDQYSGSKKATALTPLLLEKQLSVALFGSVITVASPLLNAATFARVSDGWNPKLKSNARTPLVNPSPGAPLDPAVIPAPSDPLLLERDAPELSQAALVWELRDGSSREAAQTALSLLILRFEKRAPEPVRVRVQPAFELYRAPAIRVDGPHEQVLAALAVLSEEYDRLISTYGAPSEKEWEAARLRRPRWAHFEPRCSGDASELENSEEMKLGRAALRSAGVPTAVVWGKDAPTEPAE